MKPTRRHVLRGLGAAVALPWLPSLHGVRAAEPGASRNIVFYYFPVGVIPEQFVPEGVGTAWSNSDFIKPMQRHRNELTVLSGLTNLAGTETPEFDSHESMCTSILTGVTFVRPDTVGPDGGRSADQFFADVLQGSAPFRSLELTSQADMPCRPGEFCSFREHVSWDGTDKPRSREGSPKRLFERLFGSSASIGDANAQARRLAQHKSVLDFVQDASARMQRSLGREDQIRLEAYLDGVRAVETRLSLPAVDATCLDVSSLTAADLQPASLGTEAHIELMQELMALALHCEQSHVLTYMMANEATLRTYPELGVPDAHHFVSHYGTSEERRSATKTICAWEAARFASFLDRLRALPGSTTATLLEETTVVGFGSMGDPNLHEHRELPVIVAGGRYASGRHIRAEGRPFADLLLTLLQQHGVDRASFGRDGTTPIAAL